MPTLVIIFATAFVVVTLTYLWLLRPRPSKKQFVGLGCFDAGSTGMSFVLQYFSGVWGARRLGDFGGCRADLNCVDRDLGFCSLNFTTTRPTPCHASLDNGNRYVGNNDTLVCVDFSSHNNFLREA